MALSITVDSRGMDANNRKRWSEGVLSTNNTTYAAGGLALPAKEQFGFVRSIDTFEVLGNLEGAITEYVFSWNKTTGKLQFYVSHDTAGATALPMDEEGTDATGTRTYRYKATGW